MIVHGGTRRTDTNIRSRLAVLIGVFALLATACGGTTEVDSSATTIDAETEESVDESESGDTAVDEGLEIRISDELTVLADIAPLGQIDETIESPEGATCASGVEARTLSTLPIPIGTATAQLGTTDTIIFQRLVFDSADAATAALELYGPGNCEAVVETIDGVQSDDLIIIEDQALELTAEPMFSTATTLVSDPDFMAQPNGLLPMQNGSEVVLVVGIAPTVDEITAALEAAAAPYS